jgi:hypothetical protein
MTQRGYGRLTDGETDSLHVPFCDPTACAAADCTPTVCTGAGVRSNQTMFERSRVSSPVA